MTGRQAKLAVLNAVASVSLVLGAVTALLPALVVGLVTLFYNSAGSTLIFLGNLISFVPNPFGAMQAASTLPAFQQLETHTGAVILRSTVAATLCSAAVALIVMPASSGSRRRWIAVGWCCAAAAIAGGRAVSISVLPAMAISLGCVIHPAWHR